MLSGSKTSVGGVGYSKNTILLRIVTLQYFNNRFVIMIVPTTSFVFRLFNLYQSAFTLRTLWQENAFEILPSFHQAFYSAL